MWSGKRKSFYRHSTAEALTGGTRAGDAGRVAARRRGVCPRGVPLSFALHHHFVVSTDTGSLLTAIQVTKGDPGIQDVVERDLCKERREISPHPPITHMSFISVILFLWLIHLISNLVISLHPFPACLNFPLICVSIFQPFHNCALPLYLNSTHLSPLPSCVSISQCSPILTGKPGGKRRVMKSRSLANRAFEIAMRSMIGTTCSARERGWDSHSHNLALNLGTSTRMGKERRQEERVN